MALRYCAFPFVCLTWPDHLILPLEASRGTSLSQPLVAAGWSSWQVPLRPLWWVPQVSHLPSPLALPGMWLSPTRCQLDGREGETLVPLDQKA